MLVAAIKFQCGVNVVLGVFNRLKYMKIKTMPGRMRLQLLGDRLRLERTCSALSTIGSRRYAVKD